MRVPYCKHRYFFVYIILQTGCKYTTFFLYTQIFRPKNIKIFTF